MSDKTDTIPATLSEAEARARLEKLGYPPDVATSMLARAQTLTTGNERSAPILRAFVAGQAAAPKDAVCHAQSDEIQRLTAELATPGLRDNVLRPPLEAAKEAIYGITSPDAAARIDAYEAGLDITGETRTEQAARSARIDRRREAVAVAAASTIEKIGELADKHRPAIAAIGTMVLTDPLQHRVWRAGIAAWSELYSGVAALALACHRPADTLPTEPRTAPLTKAAARSLAVHIGIKLGLSDGTIGAQDVATWAILEWSAANRGAIPPEVRAETDTVEPPIHDYGPNRCEVCGWTLAASEEQGCTPDNCSFRPLDGSPEHHRIQARRAELAKRASQADTKGDSR